MKNLNRKRGQKRICNSCGKEFIISNSTSKLTDKGKFCSRKCYYSFLSAKKKRISNKCQYCGKIHISRKVMKFCSQKCHYQSKFSDIELKCKLCGKIYFRKRSQINRTKFCSLSCKSIYTKKYLIPNRDTLIERLVESYLKNNGIPFLKQAPVEGIALVDFLLSDKIIVQCDGDYWHSSRKVKIKDSNQDLILGFKGYKVYRFSETEIKKTGGSCIEKIFKQEDLNERERKDERKED